MTSSRRFLTLALVAVLAVSSGCTWFSPKPPKETKDMIQTAITNFLAQSSYDSSATVDVTMLGKDSTGKAQSISLRGESSGYQDKPFQGGAGFVQKLNVNAKVDQDAYSGSLEMRNRDKNLFLNVMTLTGPQEQLPPEQLGSIIGKWWKIPLPDDFYAEINASLLQTQQGVWMAAYDYLKDVSYEGVDTINGVKSYHYQGDVDTGKLKAFLEGFYQSQGAEMTAENMKSFQEIFDNSRAKVEFWIAMDSMILTGVKVDLNIDKITEADGKTAGKVHLVGESKFSNFGKQMVIEEPTPSSEFNLFGMFGGAALEEGDVTEMVVE